MSYISKFGMPDSTETVFPQWYGPIVRALNIMFGTIRFVGHYCWLVITRWRIPNARDRSILIDSVIYRVPNLRHLFVTKDPIQLRPVAAHHSHQRSAQYRTSANLYMNELAVKAGFVPYNVSMSARDSFDGNRYYFGFKDLTIPFKDDVIKSDHALIFCDVDYYPDMNEWLEYFRPIIMYTFVPTTVTARRDDYAFRFVDNFVEYHVNGGGEYRHQLWDYKGDVLTRIACTGDLLVFQIEQRLIDGDPDHRIVTITPVAKIPPPYFYYLGLGPILTRKEVLNGKFSSMYDPVRDLISVAENGSWQSVELSGRQYVAIKKRLDNKTSPPVVADIERILMQCKVDDAATAAAILFDNMGVDLRKNVITTSKVPTYYQPLGSLATEDPGKLPGRAVTSSLVSDPALFPTRGYNSDEATISGRIVKVKNEVVPAPKYHEFAAEFVDRVVPNPGVGVPLAVNDVRLRQSTAQQKGRFKRAEPTLGSSTLNRLQSFIKAEPYNSINDPRNITTMSAELTIMMSCFTLEFKDSVLKNHPWFGPAKSPKATVEALRDVGTGATAWLATDYSRMDGSMSRFIQTKVIQCAYMRWVAEQYKPELKKYFDQVFIQTGKTSNGLKYKPGYSTRSGSPITSDGNTLGAAYVDYCGFRNAGLTPDEAWKALCLYYSDDGVRRANIKGTKMDFKPYLEQSAKDLGLTIKIEVVPRGQPVPYLGRYFVDPLSTEDSFQDPWRTIPKLHLTSNLQVTLEQAAANRALGYQTTDALTPIISHWCAKVLELTGITKFKGATREEQHRRSNAWPQRDPDAIYEAFLKVSGLDSAAVHQAVVRIAEATALDNIPVLFDTELEVKIGAVKDGIVVTGPHNEQSSPDQNAEKRLPTDTGRAREGVPPLAKKRQKRAGPTAQGPRGKTAPLRGKVRNSRRNFGGRKSGRSTRSNRGGGKGPAATPAPQESSRGDTRGTGGADRTE